jgi:hypothetical protein
MSPGMPRSASPRAESATIPLGPETLLTTGDIEVDGDDKTQQRQSTKFDVSVDEDVASKAARASELDLVHHIKGMYKLLDLISEQGSGGLGA